MQSAVERTNTDEARELRGLFEQYLCKLYWSENIMQDLLGKCGSIAFATDLAGSMQQQRMHALANFGLLEKIFAAIGITVCGVKDEGLQCLVDEAENLEGQIRHGVVRDAALIGILQKIRHHQIACYGTMRAFAIALREEDVVTLLKDVLEQQKEADLALSHIAESHINIEAADKEI